MKSPVRALVPLIGVLIGLQLVILIAGIGGIVMVDTVRGYVTGEGHYSKAQKDAAYALRTYAYSYDAADYGRFRARLDVPRGDARARIVLDHPTFAVEHAYEGLKAGRNHPADVPAMAWLFRTLGDTWLFEPALETWRQADRRIAQLEALGLEIHAKISGAGAITPPVRTDMLARLDVLNRQLSALEDNFSTQMGAAAREVKSIMIAGMAGLTVILAGAGATFGQRTYGRLVQAENEVLARNTRFRDFAETASDWFWETDSDHRFTYLSERLQDVTGLAPEHSLGRQRGELAAAPDDPAWRAYMADLEARRPFRDFQYALITAEGRRLHVRVSGKPIFDAAGRFCGYRGTGADVTEEIAVRDEADRQRKLLQATFDSVTDGLKVVDADNRIVVCNGRLLELLDVPADVLRPGERFETVVRYLAERGDYGPGDIDELVCQRVELLHQSVHSAAERPTPDGRVLELRANPMPDGGVVSIYTDITAHKRTEAALRRAKEEAEQASRSKNAFLANMSHELRTPLNAVIGFADMIAQRMFGPIDTRYADYGADIKSSGEHLLGIIDDVLDLSRIEADAMTLHEEPVDLGDVADGARKLVGGQARAAGVPIENAVPKGTAVRADSQRVRQLLVNLLSNAIKHSTADTPVEIRIDRRIDGIALEVVDQGVGIAEDQLQTILEPFGRAETATVADGRGVGLGLPLCRRLIELHGGRLEIDSTPGVGTVVSVVFPGNRTFSPPELADARPNPS